MADQPETRLQKRIVEALNKYPLCHVEKNHGSPYGKPKLDISGAVYGISLEIEVKMPGKEPTVRQWATIRQWRSKGAVAGWVTSVEEAQDMISPLMEIGDKVQDLLNSTRRSHLTGSKE